MSEHTNVPEGDPASGGDPPLPARIGRYRITRMLGRGGFGIAYLAFDEQLLRPVALKVPRSGPTAGASLGAQRKEAQILARLDHPNIVPIYNVESDADCPCYIVSKFVDGVDLASRAGRERLSPQEAARIVATVAEALQHAHDRGIYHRDIKPANILLDANGVPHLLDFGLALREEEYGLGSPNAGTPLYMSPEQARGEGHRIDGRSDIFSLGIVFCELLTGQRPFRGADDRAVLDEIANSEARAPRMIDGKVPRELDSFCTRALARKASDRYPRAADFAEDLRKWLEPLGQPAAPSPAAIAAPAGAPPAPRPVAPAPLPGDGPADAFISYASDDYEKALTLCALLEERRVRCWIAPRDLRPGENYGAGVIRGIESSPVLLLLLSDHSNKSIHVAHEVERAVSKRKLVVTVRLGDVLPSRALELHVSSDHWVDSWEITPHQLVTKLLRLFHGTQSPAPSLPGTIRPPSSEDDPVAIVPKGPRSFDEGDAGYFLRLLPGLRDRDGLPDGAKFWKLRVDSQDPTLAFKVGLVYGPSGCGKSSRVKAALLTRLAKSVVPVYLEASADDTEARILRELHRKVPDLPAGMGLVEAMTAIRRGGHLAPGLKLTIFLDQFEQWLHANTAEDGGVLVQALRQCDGARLQCVLMVRDEFWLAVTRFMSALEIPIEEGKNARLIDLFDLKHAKGVLILFGQAMGKLPADNAQILPDQGEFLSQAVQGLAQENKIVCVRLSLFAEMVKYKEWVPATLKAVGGIEGIGQTFLDETFSAGNERAQYREHQEAAQRVLRLLLPPSGTDIKGHRRSVQELLVASEYAGDPERFDELIRILDGELRLITLTDPVKAKKEGTGIHPVLDSGVHGPSAKSYQLTHDYLVPSLRKWLDRKNKETRRGRAELHLEECAHEWKTKCENRLLPSLIQWAKILVYVPRRRRRDETQNRIMRRANRYYATRIAFASVLLLAVGVVANEIWQRKRRTRCAKGSSKRRPRKCRKSSRNRPPPSRG